MQNLVYLNSKYIPFKAAKIPIEDRGFQFSDSVYEVVKIINKKIIGVISRVVAIILVGLSVQYILDGIKTFLA